jgi:hypothetical protein
LVCATDIAAGTLTVRRVGEYFATGDSVVVLADTDINVSSDDVWITGRISAIDTTQACNGGSAQRMTVARVTAAAANPTFDTVKVGAPVRSYIHYTYKLFTVGGGSYLGRRSASGAVVPIVGPLQSGTGLQFAYYDSLGAAATVPSQIAQMQVTLRALSGAIWQADGSHIADSITTRIYQRN